MHQVYGYIRVSSTDQNEDRQRIALVERQVPQSHIYLDKQSGKDFNRPQYKQLLQILRPGDLLYVLSIDRLGRNYEEIQNQWRVLTKAIGADVCVLDMPLLDTRQGRDLMGTFIATWCCRSFPLSRRMNGRASKNGRNRGIAAAKARGVCFGRPCVPPPADFPQIVAEWERKQIPLSEALRRAACRRPPLPPPVGVPESCRAAKKKHRCHKVYLVTAALYYIKIPQSVPLRNGLL